MGKGQLAGIPNWLLKLVKKNKSDINELKSNVSNSINSNILVNGNFAKPRIVDNNLVGWIYDYSNITPIDGYINIKNTTKETANFTQRIKLDFANKYLTLSIKYRVNKGNPYIYAYNGTDFTHLNIKNSSSDLTHITSNDRGLHSLSRDGEWHVGYFTFKFESYSSDIDWFTIGLCHREIFLEPGQVFSDIDVDIAWIKLEEGTNSTRLIPDLDEISNGAMANNILINSNFANPVNTKDITLLTKKYENLIDKWYTEDGGKGFGEASVKNGYINLNASTGFTSVIRQDIDNPNMYRNKIVTIAIKYRTLKGSNFFVHMSIRDKNNIWKVKTLVLEPSSYWTVASITIDMSKLSSGMGELDMVSPAFGCARYDDETTTWYACDTDSSIDVEWMKLEEGSIATKYYPRSYSEELRTCELINNSTYSNQKITTDYFTNFEFRKIGNMCQFIVSGATKIALTKGTMYTVQLPSEINIQYFFKTADKFGIYFEQNKISFKPLEDINSGYYTYMSETFITR